MTANPQLSPNHSNFGPSRASHRIGRARKRRRARPAGQQGGEEDEGVTVLGALVVRKNVTGNSGHHAQMLHGAGIFTYMTGSSLGGKKKSSTEHLGWVQLFMVTGGWFTLV